MNSHQQDPRARTFAALFREPLVHFFGLGLGLFLAQRVIHKEPRDIVVTKNIMADVSRRFEDVHGKPPSLDELTQEVKKWSREEALYREATRRGLEQGDAAVRSVLIDKMQMLAAAEVRDPVPTQADLDVWLSSHHSRYEVPVRYDFEFLTVDLKEQGKSQLIRLQQALARGEPSHQLGQPLRSAHLDASAMQKRVPQQLAVAIPQLSLGTWHEINGTDQSWLVRVKRTTGGLPPPALLRQQLAADWVAEQRQRKIDQILQKIIDQYQVEEQK